MSLLKKLIILATIQTASYVAAILGTGMLVQYYLNPSMWFGLGFIVVGVALYVYQYQAMRR